LQKWVQTTLILKITFAKFVQIIFNNIPTHTIIKAHVMERWDKDWTNASLILIKLIALNFTEHKKLGPICFLMIFDTIGYHGKKFQNERWGYNLFNITSKNIKEKLNHVFTNVGLISLFWKTSLVLVYMIFQNFDTICIMVTKHLKFCIYMVCIIYNWRIWNGCAMVLTYIL
jgi:hypothetical protein